MSGGKCISVASIVTSCNTIYKSLLVGKGEKCMGALVAEICNILKEYFKLPSRWEGKVIKQILKGG